MNFLSILLLTIICLQGTYSFLLHNPTTSSSIVTTKNRQILSNQYDDMNNHLLSKPFFTTPTRNSITTTQKTSTTSTTTSLHSLTTLSSSSLLINVPWIACSILGGAIGTPFVTSATKTWYSTIPLPTYTPPNVIFGPIWTFLYMTLGIASYTIRHKTTMLLASSTTTTLSTSSSNVITGMTSIVPKYIMILSYIHYILNISWAPIFFGMKRLRLGHLWNILLTISLLPVIIGYTVMDVLSGLILLPYLFWLMFAIRLSHGICKLNPTYDDKERNGKLFNNAIVENEIWKLRKEAAKNIGL